MVCSILAFLTRIFRPEWLGSPLSYAGSRGSWGVPIGVPLRVPIRVSIDGYMAYYKVASRSSYMGSHRGFEVLGVGLV